ncbi:MAG: PEP/pyruvate-binding domain-containing protein [Candidatus Hodarchaeota archaeon]
MEKQEFLLSSGIDALDDVLQGIRAGDNLVWQVESVEDYIPFVHEFCRDAYKNDRKLIYFRFGHHETLLPDDVEANIYELQPGKGFEPFLAEILRVIKEFERGACYVFDCISDLSDDWYSDIMLGNFFMITCPYLFSFDTATYFALLRNKHGSYVINSIHETAQIIIDVYNNEGQFYVRPLKVFERSSPTMYMLHAWEGEKLIPVTKSTTTTEILAKVQLPWLDLTAKRLDNWAVTIRKAQETLDEWGNFNIEAVPWKKKLIKMMIAREEKLADLADKYFKLSDLLAIGKRMIGTGLIGGKSTGLLLAGSILKRKDIKWVKKLEVLDSFFVGSDVFFTYLVENDCWWARKKLSEPSTFLENLELVKLKILEGKFPRYIIEKFELMLNYFGQSPIIVRSSSLLEDMHGNSFSGKYDSVFCANQGPPKVRLNNFLEAVKKIYASTLNKDALVYRKTRGLLNKDEQMALLVQRVSGGNHSDYFFPQVAGVGFSFNAYAWDEAIDPKAGMLRLVFGLGTRAVERTDDYTRLVALNVPTKQISNDLDEIRQYSQRKMDLLDLKENKFTSARFCDIIEPLSSEVPINLFISSDQAACFETRENLRASIITFNTLLKETSFPQEMSEILKTLEEAYSNPVDIEFTANFNDAENFKIGLVQCRSLQVKRDLHCIESPGEIKSPDLILETAGPIIGSSRSTSIDLVIYIVPSEYSCLSMQDKYQIARLIGQVNHHPKNKDKQIMVIGPGRWATSSPSLGIPVSFSEINNVSIIGEIAEMHEGLVPDVSLGTHFFNDLVELDILYFAIHPHKEGNRLNKEFFQRGRNRLEDYIEKVDPWERVIKVVENEEKYGNCIILNMDSMKQQGFCYLG